MTGSQKFTAKATAYSDTLSTLGAAVVVESAALGAEVMRHVISTSGTGWDDRLGPADGRIESGRMLADVKYDKRAAGGLSRLSGRVSRSARFGWLQRYQDYYGYQEQGFENIYKRKASDDGGPPGYTLPMNAYATAYYTAREHFRSRIRQITRKSWGK